MQGKEFKQLFAFGKNLGKTIKDDFALLNRPNKKKNAGEGI